MVEGLSVSVGTAWTSGGLAELGDLGALGREVMKVVVLGAWGVGGEGAEPGLRGQAGTSRCLPAAGCGWSESHSCPDWGAWFSCK